MIKALYTASSGMVAQSTRQDVIANNIANAQTPGFKRERVVSVSFRQTLDATTAALSASSRPPYPNSPIQSTLVNVEQANDNSDGALRSTGLPLQFAIEGTGTFEVGSGASARQTRNGSFIVDADGEMATPDGDKVQGQSGAIRMPQGEWSVTADGTIVDARGNQIDKIKINGADTTKTRVMQGYLEDSNVNIVREMVDMITNMRSYEANQKVLASVDGTLDKLINEAGKV